MRSTKANLDVMLVKNERHCKDFNFRITPFSKHRIVDIISFDGFGRFRPR